MRSMLCIRCLLAVMLLGLVSLLLPTTSAIGDMPLESRDRAMESLYGAQSGFERLASLTISIWLEYDRPGVLFIYRGVLPRNTPLPARLIFRLPRQPTLTAVVDEGGQLRYVEPHLSQEGAACIVAYATSSAEFQLEYYDDSLQRRGAERELYYTYRSEYAVEQLALEVKEAFGVTRFDLEPPPDVDSQSSEGLLLHRRLIGPVARGEELHWRISYTKSDPRLVAEALGLPAAAPVSVETRTAGVAVKTANDRATWAAMALVGLIAMGGLGLVARANTVSSLKKPAPRRRTSAAKPTRAKVVSEPPAPEVRQARFCHRCGTTMRKGDSYCRKCGTRRRGT
ncbi:MAG: zinc ribbon domain-containing protein [Anaerolineae bacterium]